MPLCRLTVNGQNHIPQLHPTLQGLVLLGSKGFKGGSVLTTLNEVTPQTEEVLSPPSRSPRSWLTVGAVVGLAFCLGLYCVVRYSGLWLTGDIAGLVKDAQLTTLNGQISLHLPGSTGFGNALLLKILSDFTGFTPLALAQTVLPLLLALIAVALAGFYRSLNLRGWLIAALLMLVQPVFVSSLVNTALIFGFLLIIVILTTEAQRPGENYSRTLAVFQALEENKVPLNLKQTLLKIILLLTLTGYDRYLAGLVLLVLALSLAIGNLKSYLIKSEKFPLLPILYILVPCGLVWLISLVVFPLPPANFTGFLPESEGWLNFPVYLMLNGISGLILGLGLVQWLRQAKKPAGQIWNMFGASWFLLLAMPFLPQPYIGAVWAMLLLFATPLAVEILLEISNKLIATTLIEVILLGAGICAVLSVTRDPLVSHHWLYISKAEQLGYQWSEQFLENEPIWSGFEGQLPAYAALAQEKNKNSYQNSQQPTTTLLISERLEVWATRQLKLLPDTIDKNKVYDNGKAWIYR
jgi:hypothetical protein